MYANMLLIQCVVMKLLELVAQSVANVSIQSHGGKQRYDVGGEVQLPTPTSYNGGTTTTAESSTSDAAAGMEVEGGFFFKTPMDNLVIKTFQFPVRYVCSLASHNCIDVITLQRLSREQYFVCG